MLTAVAALVGTAAMAQSNKWRDIHKVKKKETVFGIARDYGLTVDELLEANPELKDPKHKLKKDTYVFIPYAKPSAPAAPATRATAPATVAKPTVPATIRLGVMLPLHDVNGDGRRMVEYYRGLLMACDSLRRQGISVDVHAWNTPDDEDITPVLQQQAARDCDLIVGPLYSKQMEKLSTFVQQHDIRLVIPFSITAPQLVTNRNIFQVYQSPSSLNESVIDHYVSQFAAYHPVFVDCNDSTSQKGTFTFNLRRRLEARGIAYDITNLKSSEGNFARAFSTDKPNMVILNTGRSPELGVAFAKLGGLATSRPGLRIAMFGYTEWMMYTKTYLENFYRFNVYIPAVFHYNPLMSRTLRLEQMYRRNFRQDMMNAQPRFALTGFDHAMFFLKGFHRYGRNFTGAEGTVGYDAVQTPLRFERYAGGGLRNRSLLFVHYTPAHKVEHISF